MLLIRVYIALLALVLLLLSLLQSRVGILEATVITCSLLFLILDTHLELQVRRKLEKQIMSMLEST